MTELATLLEGAPYLGYAYAYPHKTAYRPLAPRPLREVWAAEPRDALFLYAHIPFCEMRCGFCNLFTTVNPASASVTAYLDALERQIAQLAPVFADATWARMAIGGGTPTYLEPAELERLFALLAQLGAHPSALPASVETSPHTATAERLAVLRAHGVERISIGVQSFIEDEARAAGRAQRTSEVAAALGRIKAQGFPTLNLDLIYGLPGQTPDSWRFSLEQALAYAPEELYLYPLYVRPLTGLARRAADDHDDLRLACYRLAREHLLAAGYTQVSMRMFRAPHAPAADGPAYCCQTDGMVGLGAGARSYTRGLHYATEYAVGASGVRAIIADFAGRADFAHAHYGCELDADEQRRRYAMQSLLQAEGLDSAAYASHFGSTLADDLPELDEIVACGLGAYAGPVLRLNERGLEASDVIGPWLASDEVRQRMQEYVLR